MSWYKPHGSLAHEHGPMSITPEQAEWAYSGLHVIDRDCTLDLGASEAVVLPLSARDLVVLVDGVPYPLRGREGVFAAVSDWLYVPRGKVITLADVHGEVAILTARARADHPVHYTPAEDEYMPQAVVK